jgi:hypothetical protein
MGRLAGTHSRWSTHPWGLMFQYKGKREYELTPALGRAPATRAKGYWFSDYHANRHLFIRPTGRDKYHVKMVVLGKVTTDIEMTKAGLISWAINHLQFQITENQFKVMR